jgi:hypothetical protein
MSFAQRRSSAVIENTVSQLSDSLIKPAYHTPRTRVAEAPTRTPLKRRYMENVHDVKVVKKIKLQAERS